MVDILPQRPPIDERFFIQCSLNAVEDENHLLMICPKYASHSAKVNQHLNNTIFASQSYGIYV